jgi:Kef-type K+ transport system membrane component KefB
MLWIAFVVCTVLVNDQNMIPGGEVGLILAGVGKKNGIFDDMIYSVVVFVVALTTLFVPGALRFVMRGEE